MEKKYVVGDLNTELEEIELMNEQMQETKDNYVITYSGAFFTILCCT